jgi:hypothetical protein
LWSATFQTAADSPRPAPAAPSGQRFRQYQHVEHISDFVKKKSGSYSVFRSGRPRFDSTPEAGRSSARCRMDPTLASRAGSPRRSPIFRTPCERREFSSPSDSPRRAPPPRAKRAPCARPRSRPPSTRGRNRQAAAGAGARLFHCGDDGFPGKPMNPPIEEMLTIAPDFWARMSGRTARVMAARPKKLVSNIARVCVVALLEGREIAVAGVVDENVGVGPTMAQPRWDRRSLVRVQTHVRRLAARRIPDIDCLKAILRDRNFNSRTARRAAAGGGARFIGPLRTPVSRRAMRASLT